MSWAVNTIGGSLAGTHQAAKAATRSSERKEPARARRARDEFDQTAEAGEVEHAEAVRSLKDNSQEEAHEDRQQHGEQGVALGEHREPSPQSVYTSDAEVRPAPAGPSGSLDLRG